MPGGHKPMGRMLPGKLQGHVWDVWGCHPAVSKPDTNGGRPQTNGEMLLGKLQRYVWDIWGCHPAVSKPDKNQWETVTNQWKDFSESCTDTFETFGGAIRQFRNPTKTSGRRPQTNDTFETFGGAIQQFRNPTKTNGRRPQTNGGDASRKAAGTRLRHLGVPSGSFETRQKPMGDSRKPRGRTMGRMLLGKLQGHVWDVLGCHPAVSKPDKNPNQWGRCFSESCRDTFETFDGPSSSFETLQKPVGDGHKPMEGLLGKLQGHVWDVWGVPSNTFRNPQKPVGDGRKPMGRMLLGKLQGYVWDIWGCHPAVSKPDKNQWETVSNQGEDAFGKLHRHVWDVWGCHPAVSTPQKPMGDGHKPRGRTMGRMFLGKLRDMFETFGGAIRQFRNYKNQWETATNQWEECFLESCRDTFETFEGAIRQFLNPTKTNGRRSQTKGEDASRKAAQTRLRRLGVPSGSFETRQKPMGDGQTTKAKWCLCQAHRRFWGGKAQRRFCGGQAQSRNAKKRWLCQAQRRSLGTEGTLSHACHVTELFKRELPLDYVGLHHICISIIWRKAIMPCFPQYNYARKNFKAKLWPELDGVRAAPAPGPRRHRAAHSVSHH